MNLGTQTSSLVNHLYSRATIGSPDPKVGMPATVLMWSDRHAATVTKVTELSGQWKWEIEVTEDTVTAVRGSIHDGSAVFETAPNPDGYVGLYRMRRVTREWVHGYINQDTGKFNKSSGGLIVGKSEHYVDPSF